MIIIIIMTIIVRMIMMMVEIMTYSKDGDE